jgi:hypothetical protein
VESDDVQVASGAVVGRAGAGRGNRLSMRGEILNVVQESVCVWERV